ncbi:hypothetical protein [Micromonospora sp. NBS 11-29]|uniref:hypothetical protein n=1 Tax=Micromonospora sp. NBS 11-29 TaxID=1960879 RepID=UPI000B782F7B|nr:hypothetical protein [Micromonospora sp. NBS 11-29]
MAIRKASDVIDRLEVREEMAREVAHFLACFDNGDLTGMREIVGDDDGSSAGFPGLTGDEAEDAHRIYHWIRKRIRAFVHLVFEDRRRAGRLVRRSMPLRGEVTTAQAYEALGLCLSLIKIKMRELNKSHTERQRKVRGSMEALERVVEHGGIR